MTGSPNARWKVSVPSSSVATCSDLFVWNGPMIDGKGWWGDSPPYHAPTFVLTHYPRRSIEMQGGTTFHFVTDGIDAALQKARETAGAKDVKIGGRVETVKQYVLAGYVDEINLAIAPTALGQGESLFSGVDLHALGYRTVEHVPTDRATHIVLAK